MDQFVLSSDQRQLGTTGGSRDHEEPIDHCRGMRECSGDVPRPSSVARKVAAVTSPLPVKVCGSRGVVTSHAPSALTATMSMVPGGASWRTTLVTNTTSGPSARAASAAFSASSMVETGRPVSDSNSNWLG